MSSLMMSMTAALPTRLLLGTLGGASSSSSIGRLRVSMAASRAAASSGATSAAARIFSGAFLKSDTPSHALFLLDAS
jgi:hypothetical protein